MKAESDKIESELREVDREIHFYHNSLARSGKPREYVDAVHQLLSGAERKRAHLKNDLQYALKQEKQDEIRNKKAA